MNLYLKYLLPGIAWGILATSASKCKHHFNTAEHRSIDTIVLGDINNDKIIDTAFVKGASYPAENSDSWDCTNCNTEITFSNGLPTIYCGNAIGAQVCNIGDIDEDGAAEIMIIPWWFVGCWSQLHFHTLKNSSWNEFERAKIRICEDEDLSLRVKKIKKNKFSVTEDIPNEDYSEVKLVKRIIRMK
jgi:hypothetical protein